MSNYNELTSQLKEVVNSKPEDIDFGLLLKLANDLSLFDKKNVRFKVDAKIVERLGEQLVAKKTTALSELIKNSYDADAKFVEVNFINTEQPFGEIQIYDNGQGMHINDLVSGFMTISTSDKIDNPKSNVYLRERAGRKGIGRFSAQKLGTKLKIVTKRKEDTEYMAVEIDWDMFVSGLNVNEIENKINFVSGGYDFQEGTLLLISQVKEAWTESNIKTSFNYISSLIKINPNKKHIDPGFEVKFTCKKSSSSESNLIVLDNNTEFYSFADLDATAYMHCDGYLLIEITGLRDDVPSEILKFEEGFNETLLEVGYEYKVKYFAMEREGTKSKSLQNFLNTNGGIKFYRNGFSVAPYGERLNDWIGLDESSRRRVILPPHANTNFLGSVSVSDIDGNKFEETSSREGVIENDAFRQLSNTTKDISLKIAAHVAGLRNKKVTSSQQNYKSSRKNKEDVLTDKISNLKDSLSKIESAELVKSNNEDLSFGKPQEAQSNTAENSIGIIIQQVNDVQEVLNEYIDERLLYRVLSSTGLAISEFTHEIQMCIVNLKISSQQISEIAQEHPEVSLVSNQLEDNISLLVAYTDFFDGTMRSNSNREKNFYDLRKVIKAFFNGMSPTLKRRGYNLETMFDTWGIWTKKVHYSELLSILINLFTNSCKAIDRSGVKVGKIFVDVKTTDEYITILFQDNGDGIPKDKWAKVFTPLYTTSMPAKSFASDNEYARGMGLGLSITEDIINEMNGEISIIEPSVDFSTCVKIVLPKASEDELNDNSY